jgi:hypothetical protein
MRRSTCIIAWMCGACLAGAERDDPVISAAQQALERGQPVVALQLIQQMSSLSTHGATHLGQASLITAQAHNALGDGRAAAQALRLQQVADLSAWSETWRAPAAAAMGEAWIIMGDARAASTWLAQALRLKVSGYAVDRTILLLAESLWQINDQVGAERYASALWRDWPRSPYRATAGLMVVRCVAERDALKAREILAGVRAIDGLDAARYVEATVWLCRLLLDKQPAQCLAIADQALRRVGQRDELFLYRALALCALDAQAGAQAIAALSPEQQRDPAVLAARQRIEQRTHNSEADRYDRARAAIALGQLQNARELLEKPAFSHVAALQLLATIPDVDLSRYATAPVVQDAAAAGTLGIIFAQQQKYTLAWDLLQKAARELARGHDAFADVLYWTAITARQVAPAHAHVWHKQLLALPGPGIAQGLAWADEAQLREQSGAAGPAIREAWEKAALALPATHAWHARQPGVQRVRF